MFNIGIARGKFAARVDLFALIAVVVGVLFWAYKLGKASVR